MRGTAVSSGVFRTLLIFCDTYIASVLATYSARMMGYHLQTFYTHDKQFPEVKRSVILKVLILTISYQVIYKFVISSR